MSGKSCFIMRHRDAPDDLLPPVEAVVEQHITDYGVTEFIVGHYGRFEQLAVQAVRTAKVVHPNIFLLLLLPYHPVERPLETPAGFDGTFYPPGMESVPRRLAITRRNRYMADHVDYLIAYVWHATSNSKELVKLAYKNHR